MKKSITLLCFLFSALLTLSAQIEYGLKVGVNLADVVSPEVGLPGGEPMRLESDLVIRPQLGAWMLIAFNDHLALRPELLYTQKGWRAADVPDPNTLNHHYLELPVLLNYQLKNWHLAIGPSLSYLISQRFQDDTGVVGDENPLFDEGQIDLAVNAGVGYTFNRWHLALRYARDLTPFLDVEVTDFNGQPLPDDQGKYYHTGLQLSLGYSL